MLVIEIPKDGVTRKGGNRPIVPQTWRDEVALTLLESIYDGHDLTEELLREVARRLNPDRMEKTYGHMPTSEEIRGILRTLFIEGLTAISAYNCTCCAKRGLPFRYSEILEHSKSFVLTHEGKQRIPERVLHHFQFEVAGPLPTNLRSPEKPDSADA